MNDLRYLATLRKPDGSEVHRDTTDRLEFLAWLGAHYQNGDDLTISMAAHGAAVWPMVMALHAGALRKPQT